MAESNGIQPKALEDKPVLTEFAAGYLKAFSALSNSRSIGMNGPLPIQINEIWALLQVVGVCHGVRFMRLIQTLDGMWLDDYVKRNK